MAVLSASQCGRIVKRLEGLRAHWQQVPADDDAHAFYMIGPATYLLAPQITFTPDKRRLYTALARKGNALMHLHFSDLLSRVTQVLSQGLGQPVRLPSSRQPLAWPSFHIFVARAGVPCDLAHGGMVHLDNPYLSHRFPFEVRGHVSFTLPIANFAGGCGLNYWPTPPWPMEQVAKPFPRLPEEIQTWLTTYRRYWPYRLGQMVAHDGNTPHQVANMTQAQEGEYRITLQGHAVSDGQTWWMFF
ncbi:MAG: hypothetical protein ACFCBW_17670 [Candidatus Competibacterales bacterium]